jgi:hypothetical protein
MLFMKNFSKLSYLLLLLLVWTTACKEEERGQYAVDSIPPGQVSNVSVQNVAGGAIITYTIPDDDDLLYVKVVYTMSDGTKAVQKSSAHTPVIKVEGLGYCRKQTVQLICGDRSGNESTPVLQEIEPLDSPIYDIYQSLKMQEDFGGVKVIWDNPLKENIVLTLYVQDESQQFVETQNVYSNSASGSFNLRGYPDVERIFAVSIRDRWSNKTEKMSGTFTPRKEQKLDRLKFSRWNPSGIPYYALDASWSIERIWDGLIINPGFSFPQTVNLPQSITFNLGQTAYLNRIKFWQRTDPETQIFNGYSTKRFQLYGSASPNVSADFDTWVFLGDFTSQKPSGLPIGQLTQEDMDYVIAGEEFTVEYNSDVPIHYIRFHIMETWSGGMNVAQLVELEFYGQIIE